jgi:hypothetical protein
MTGVVVGDVAKGGYLKDDSADDEEVALYDLMIDMGGEGRGGMEKVLTRQCRT